MTLLKPLELGAMTFKNTKKILNQDLQTLTKGSAEEGLQKARFYIELGIVYSDKVLSKSNAFPMLIISDFKGTWKKHIDSQVKPPNKHTALGYCTYDDAEKILTLIIEKGRVKVNEIKKAFLKGNLLPQGVTLSFEEQPNLEGDEEIDALNDVQPTKEDKLYSKVLENTNVYKAIPLTEGKKRIKQIDKTLNLIKKWEKKHQEIDPDDADETERYNKLMRLKAQLYSHKEDIYIRGREGAEPIDHITSTWEAYQRRPFPNDVEKYIEVEDRLDLITDLEEEITNWLTRNIAPWSEEETIAKNTLEEIRKKLAIEVVELNKALIEARKEHVKAVITKLLNATDVEKAALKEDDMFLLELARTIPVAQINDVRHLIGLAPVVEQGEADIFIDEEREEWKDPEVQALFKEFSKFSKFEAAIDHKVDPAVKKRVKVPALTSVRMEVPGKDPSKYPEGKLGSDYIFELISEDVNGIYRLKGVSAKGDTFVYVPKASVVSETEYKVLPVNTPLFPTDPNKTHVQQGGLGDCYLLAALTNLVHKDPDFIKGMMFDKGNTVTVRLFETEDVEKGGKTTRKFTAKYFNIDKSIVESPEDKDAYAQEYLWVQMIEKAYAAGGFTGQIMSYVKGAPGTYAKIEGGIPSFAYEVLTGQPASNFLFTPLNPKEIVAVTNILVERGKPTNLEDVKFFTLPWSTQEIENIKNADYNKSMVYKLTGKNIANTLKWKDFVQRGSIDTLFNREFNKDYSGELTLYDFQELFQGRMKDAKGKDVPSLAKLDPVVATVIIDLLTKYKIYPGKRGSGIYSEKQLFLFTEIESNLTAGKMVSLGSKQTVGRTTDGIGHSGGEKISGGFVGGHIYPVLDTRIDNAPLKELELRNPWGKTVQKNLKNKDWLPQFIEKLKKLITEAYISPANDALLAEKKRIQTEGGSDQEKKTYQKNVASLKLFKTNLSAAVTLDEVKAFKSKIPNQAKPVFDGLVKEYEKIAKLPPEDLVGKTELESEVGQEGGEFWALLDDITKRFTNLFVG